ncbi:glycosyltransferase family 2 protein [Mesobacillus thioparans]|uniref:glycosyltransferase family 2 protein n=1 Tax=Mesobacillus thioparans TaxID=370439 RepID=UPI0039F06012
MVFSIIIPVYNAEKYVKEAIESILKQTLDFCQNTEIILVDDGSTDDSRIICTNYVQQFPNNIKYIYSENSGPGSARNKGLDLVNPESQYIGFLDADDYFSGNALESIDLFFKQNPTVQLSVIPLYHFEKIDTPHRLNYRFEKGDRIVDITKDYKDIHFHIGGCFFRAGHILNNAEFRFRSDLKFWEDALFINTFLLEHQNYGLVSTPKYYYRKRHEEDSLVNNAWYDESRYTNMLNQCYGSLVEESIRMHDKVLPYIQFLIVYHIRLYLLPKNNEVIYEVLSVEEQKVFFNELVHLLQQFENKYIKEQDMPFYYKRYLLSLKKHGWPYKQSKPKIANQDVSITKIRFRGLKWHIEGNFMNKEYFMKPEDQLFIKCNNKIMILPKKLLPSKRRVIWGSLVRDYEHAGFDAHIPIYCNKFQFGIITENKRILLNTVNLLKEMSKIK